jgi:hypothetical protein
MYRLYSVNQSSQHSALATMFLQAGVRSAGRLLCRAGSQHTTRGLQTRVARELVVVPPENSPARFLRCVGCGQPMAAPMVCSSCLCVGYCGPVCAVRDTRHTPEECSAHRRYLARDVRVHLPTNPAWLVAGMDHRADTSFCDVLAAMGVHDEAGYRLLCGCDAPPSPPSPHRALVEPLPPPPPSPPHEADVTPPSDWAAYYSWRGLALDSPLAVLLSFPLTLHHILARHVLPALPRSRDTAPQPVRVHLLGPEKELALLPLFAELAHLHPATTIDIEMVGPAGLALPPPTRFDGRLGGSVTVTAHGGLYHEPLLLAHRGAADVVVALNAGLAAPGYDWSPTLGTVQRSGVPFFFTDYSEYSIEKAAAFAQLHAMAGALPVRLNPFRAPLRQPLVVGGAVAFPWVSNGFLAGFANGGRVASGGDAGA